MLSFNSYFASKIFFLGGKSLSFSDLFLSIAVCLQPAVLTLALASAQVLKENPETFRSQNCS